MNKLKWSPHSPVIKCFIGIFAVGASLSAVAGKSDKFTNFTNVSDQIDFVRSGLATGSDGVGGVAWFDYDNDGALDLFLPHGKVGNNALFRNLGHGNFINSAANAGLENGQGNSGVLAADLDNDGYVDLLLTGDGGVIGAQASPIKLYHNQGDGTFQDITAGSGIIGPESALAVSAADIDSDGDLDIFITAPGSLALQVQHASILFRNNGDMTFTDITNAAGVSASQGACVTSFSDYDQDGDQDLFVGSCNDVFFRPTPIQLFQNQGDGTFKDVTIEAGLGSVLGFWMALSFSDYDNDGDIDFFMTNAGLNTPFIGFNEHALLENNGDGTFSNVANIAGVAKWEFGWGATFADFDNNGYDDLFFTGSLPPPPFSQIGPGIGNPGRLFINNLGRIEGEKTFAERSDLMPIDLSNEFTSGVAKGDFNNDGFVDLAILTETFTLPGKPVLLKNDPGHHANRNHWLGFQLQGVESNRDAVGARVEVYGKKYRRVKEIYAGSSFASTETKRLVFGLGHLKHIKFALVRWPSGTSEVFLKNKVNHYNKLVEGEGLVSW